MDPAEPSKIVCLRDVVSTDDLRDRDGYTDVLEDMREEGSKYGNLVTVVMPRPEAGGGGLVRGGVGKVFFVYADVRSASAALTGINGRMFAGRVINAVFYPEDRFAHADLDG
ncbi:hypothetical protein MLD38_031902 [Melastoma candidum]|uniref:Uncharacterized protein n=1 Tax=Melastoma candidum TaxID=119954 RepID=A0ACB9MQK9_9MYRT|nr:hypothetical protein MLD38_031902 [Melastoma candidum]